MIKVLLLSLSVFLSGCADNVQQDQEISGKLNFNEADGNENQKNQQAYETLAKADEEVAFISDEEMDNEKSVPLIVVRIGPVLPGVAGRSLGTLSQPDVTGAGYQFHRSQLLGAYQT